MAVTFYNDFVIVTGQVTKQLSQTRFAVSDGTTTKICYLAPTTDIALAVGDANPDYFTIPVYPPGNGSGATFTPMYVPNVISVWVNGGIGYLVGDQVMLVASGNALLTVTSTSTTGAIVTATVTPGDSLDGIPSNPLPILFQSGGVSLQGSIAGTVLTVISISSGTILRNQILHGVGVSIATIITGQLTGTTGGTGTYSLNRSSTVSAEAMTLQGTGGFFNVGWVLDSVTIDGSGVDYSVNDTLIFSGIIASLLPTAYIDAVSAGVPQSVTLTKGRDITVAADHVDISGPVEYVKSITARRLTTTDGNSYYWTLASSHDQSAVIQTLTVIDS